MSFIKRKSILLGIALTQLHSERVFGFTSYKSINGKWFPLLQVMKERVPVHSQTGL